MSCCPAAPVITIGGSGSENSYAPDSPMNRGESVECYMARTGNSTGQLDDKTEDIPDKIKNNDIPMLATATTASVNVTFTMTSNSTRTATSWKLFVGEDQVTTLGVNNSITMNGAVLSGNFATDDIGKKFNIKISAYDSTGEIDQRGFVFSPAFSNGSDEIRFLHPMPGAIVSSPFGPRKPPRPGASSKHEGADFKMLNRSVVDVLAAADGTVDSISSQPSGGGNILRIRHLNGSGKHLCTTAYMHLSKIYVERNQKVSAGQKVAHEGSTGCSTGPHLHFECRLPNNHAVDPVPLIKGGVDVAGATTPSNDAVAGTVAPVAGDAVLTKENVDAKSSGCAAFGPDYPKNSELSDTPLPTTSSTDPFERAWFFTELQEIGQWTDASPDDPEIAAGLIETTAQRKKVGYVNKTGFPGGNTKFGIAQSSNPQVSVPAIPYNVAKQTGYNGYWKFGSKPPMSYATTKPKASIMLFDMVFLHGVGNMASIRNVADIESKTDEAAAEALYNAQQNFINNIGEPRQSEYGKGWRKRSNALFAYVKTLTFT